ncbi:hypothetical protein HDF18_20395 [Mucilaginibacter sp. X5P1]|uniref:hypothetical protein n=1 Tax=Mucilaginibacter sp. X5P1 TaxID=2723088 RepID=UPI00160EAA51|nr:hypothetical protein [Mucilaginibacter sp. X5P1]MBB6139965.1 hypothetical protein [Mucilaginibacter sp. X5P1]
MKKLNYSKLIPIMAFVAISVTVLNYKTGLTPKHIKVHNLKQDTSEELGEFEYPAGSGNVYKVEGTSSPNVVTGVYFFYTGLPVASFTSKKLGGWLSDGTNNSVVGLTVTPNTGDTPFPYSGELTYY